MFSLHKTVVSLLLISVSASAIGGNPYRIPPGAAEAGMGSVSVMKPGFWSSFRNPGLLPLHNSFSAGIGYENRFGIAELGTRTAGVIIPARGTSLGAVYSHFGYPDFRRQNIAIGCGLSLSDNISGGIQVHYFSEKTSGEYDNNQFITFDAGVEIGIGENTKIGINLFNPVPGSLRKSFLPSAITLGAGVDLSKVLFAAAEIEMSSGSGLLLRTGFEYEMLKKFRLRGGFCTENTSFTFGTGYQIRSFNIDLSFATHERLGITSCASIIFKIK